MKKTLLIIGTVGLAVMAAQAETLSPEQALSRATANGPAQVRAAASSSIRPQLLLTTYAQDAPAAYIFSNGEREGYMVVAADDVAVPVLGYSDSANFDAGNMPPALSYWLDMYAAEIEHARANGAGPASAPAYVNPSWTLISPLCTTTWNQTQPYNNLCPEYNGRRSVTGCVATAMAQFLKYHNYPPQGQGSNMYSASAIGQQVSCNFANYTFDWANMLNSYSGTSANDAQKQAVAELMFCCGASVNMNYSPDQSGASSHYIPIALNKYFNYSKNAHLMDRDYYALSVFQEAVYNELKDNSPVIYSGTTKNHEGHCFICDGYDGNGFFHFNWGWGGMSDGYFLLTGLTPDAQGVGGASDAEGFNYNQDICVGARPDGGQGEYAYTLACNGGYTMSPSSVALGGNITVNAKAGMLFYNASPCSVSGTIGINFISSDGSQRYVHSGQRIEFNPMYGLTTYSVRVPSDLAEGTYTVQPAWVSSDGVNHKILIPITQVQTYKMEVSNSRGTLTPNDIDAAVEVTSLKAAAPKLFAGYRLKFDVQFTNPHTGEYLGLVQAGLYSASSSPATGKKPDYLGNEVFIDVEPGQTLDYTYISAFGKAPVGEYTLYFFYPQSYEWISSGLNVSIESAPSADQTQLAVANFQLQDGLTYIVDNSNIVFTFDIECVAGFFDGTLKIGVAEKGKSYFRGTINTPDILLYEGEMGQVTAFGSMSALKEGVTYEAFLCNGSKKANAIAGPYEFIYSAEGGIGSIAADAQPANVEIYSLQGVKLLEKPASGLYIKVATYPDGTQEVTREITK